MSKYSPKHVIQCYELASNGFSNEKIAKSLGISNFTFRQWLKKQDHFSTALKMGREKNKRSPLSHCSELIYERLSPQMQALWEDLTHAHETGEGLSFVLSVLEREPREHRQQLFLYAWASSLFNITTACKMVNIGTTTFYTWCRTSPEFRMMVQEIEHAKKDLFEQSLIQGVLDGEPGLIKMANQTLNSDRGYGKSVEVKGSVDHTHLVFDISTLELDRKTKHTLLGSIRKKEQQDALNDDR